MIYTANRINRTNRCKRSSAATRISARPSLARKASNLRQVDVARKASVRQALVFDIENGATTAKLDTVIRVLAALDLDLSVIRAGQPGSTPRSTEHGT